MATLALTAKFLCVTYTHIGSHRCQAAICSSTQVQLFPWAHASVLEAGSAQIKLVKLCFVFMALKHFGTPNFKGNEGPPLPPGWSLLPKLTIHCQESGRFTWAFHHKGFPSGWCAKGKPRRASSRVSYHQERPFECFLGIRGKGNHHV